MSLLNVFVRPQSVLVVVDTAIAMADAPGASIESAGAASLPARTSGVTKLAVLPHVRAVVAGRGNFGFAQELWRTLAFWPGRDFDTLAERLHHGITIACDAVDQVLKTMGRRFDGRFGEVVLVGWSEGRGRVRAVGAWDEEGAIEIEDIADQWTTPGTADFPKFANYPTREDLVTQTIAQVQHFRRLGVTALGGQLVIAEVTRAGVALDWSVDIEAATQPDG